MRQARLISPDPCAHGVRDRGLSGHRRRCSELGELILDILGLPLVSLGGWLDPQGAEQLRGRGTGVTRLTQDRMQSLVSQVVKDQVDYAPRVEGLTGLRTWSVHEAAPESSAGMRKYAGVPRSKRRPRGAAGLNLRQGSVTSAPILGR